MAGEQDLKLRAKLEGGEETARGVEKIAGAEENLADKIKRVADASSMAVRSVANLGAEIGRLIFWSTVLFGTFSQGLRWMKGAKETMVGMATGSKSLVYGLGKLVMSLRATTVLMKVFLAGGAAVHGIRAIVTELRREIAERMRLKGVIEEQSRAMDLLKGERRDVQAGLERVAGRRRMGGFAGADVSRGVTAGAFATKEQFGQLEWSDITAAFGEFGDVGLSREELTRLAIVASFGELQVPEGLPETSRKGFAQRLLKRFQPRIERFERTETVQGEGIGRAEFRPRATERAQEIAGEVRAEGAGTELLRKRLKEMLPAGADIEKGVELFQMYGSAKVMKEAEVGFTNALRPIETLLNRWSRQVEVMLIDQPGYLAQGLEALGINKDMLKMRRDEFEAYLKAYEQLEREGGISKTKGKTTEAAAPFAYLTPEGEEVVVAAQKEAAEASKEAAEAMKEAAAELRAGGGKTEIGPHARIVYPDAAAVKRNTVNGESDQVRRKVG